MSAPKDPEKLAAYREKRRQIALEGGYGKWMEGRKHSPETIEKMRQQQRERGNDPNVNAVLKGQKPMVLASG